MHFANLVNNTNNSVDVNVIKNSNPAVLTTLYTTNFNSNLPKSPKNPPIAQRKK